MSTGLLETRRLVARYGSVEVLHGIDLSISPGEIVVLLGPNGAGKTTLLRAISRVVATRGAITLAGVSIGGWSGARTARAGIGHVPEGRGTFPDLTVEENLRLGGLARPKGRRSTTREDLAQVYATFPVLADMRRRAAGLLSGGQQQMLAIGRALMARPQLLLIDEPSLGLAPMVTQQLFEVLAGIRGEWSTSLLLAEQNARLSLRIADRAVVLAGGRVTAAGPTADFRDGDVIRRAYLGEAAGDPVEDEK
ncbi:ABC transporter ATP-binding protein [Acrocarpospora macrocephala]|uniref:ABC transporter ATP-binding protein n=1 Tax=Acrocarpospora macrocephala TaxID=150177 RepID=A0A5M3WLI8_9ACTN|nr:ABC transporter ATP-binding protein [Acrocarpospora macrocephala]GES09734.1 ABC transporter ATP-binding protein [Acrocarpospora macrocephala]